MHSGENRALCIVKHFGRHGSNEEDPVGPLEVRLRLPGGFHPGKAIVLTNGLEIAQERRGHELVLTVPEVNEYEVVAIPRAS